MGAQALEIMIDPQTMRNTLRYWASGVAVVTTADAEGLDRAGMTVSAFNSLSVEPAMILVCVSKETTTAHRLQVNMQFAISVLPAGDSALSDRFAGRIPLADHEDRFTGVETMTALTGSPILSEALAWLDCRVEALLDGTTHWIAIGEVLAAGSTGGDPLIYFDRHYRSLDPLAE